MKKEYAVYAGNTVRIICIAEGYAMVRRKGAMPFVVKVKDLARAIPRNEVDPY